MRWALADAGDALDDANFETTTANAAILRLTKELAWIEEVLAPGAGAVLGMQTVALSGRVATLFVCMDGPCADTAA